MAKFKDSANTSGTKQENEESLKDLGISIEIVDRKKKKTHKISDEDIVDIRFKDVGKATYIRFIGEDGTMISINTKKVPKFMEIETIDKQLW